MFRQRWGCNISVNNMKPIASRSKQLEQLSDHRKVWDIVVIGGGASGLGVALDAISRGYSVLLLEQADFAKGTSSRSTKLVHGGVRYLAQGDVGLVREASIERWRLCRNAPHLVSNQTFVIPIYSYVDLVKYIAGLKLYDWISGKYSLGSSVLISRKKTLEALPGIKADGLVGGVRYHDGQFDDSRLAVNLVQTIIAQRGCVLNYMRVDALAKDENGAICGVRARDLEDKVVYHIQAKAVVNATGVFVDEVLRMDRPELLPSICVSQGVHLVVDKKFYPSQHALMIPETPDGRVLFAVPWHGRVVLGTTDTPVLEATLEPVALEKEIDFILKTAGDYLAERPGRDDVLSVFAGLRPLAAPQKSDQKTKEISRSHKILVSPARLFTILGGKWTTFRKMGEDVIDHIEKKCGWKRRRSASAGIQVHGYAASVDRADPLYFYGSNRAALAAEMNGSAGNWLSELLFIHRQQVIWAVRHEMARTVEDVLARRTRALFLDAKESLAICPETARIMAEELQKDQDWVETQIESYTKTAQHYILHQNNAPQSLAV